LRHVFCDEEIAYAQKQKFPSQHFAARFAAKEAVLKAIGDNAHIHWKDLLIRHHNNGKPYCIFNDKTFNKTIAISISHTKNYAVANAVITP